MTRCPSQRAYARCDGQLAGFAAGTARQRADDCDRLFNCNGADACGLRLSMWRRPTSVAAGRFREVCFCAILELRRQAEKINRLLQQGGFGAIPSPFADYLSRLELHKLLART